MTRVYDYDEFMAERRSTMASRMVAVAEARSTGARRSRPRTEEEREAIIRAAVAHVRRLRESGELTQIGPRLYALK